MIGNREAYRPIEILMVEDNSGDVRLTVEALKEGKVRNNFHTLEDGEAAMIFLSRQEPYTDVSRPDLVLLDLNSSKKNGREVLAEIEDARELKRIPVVILMISEAEQDILKSYNLHANCYITKPVNLDQFTKVVRFIEDFWLSIVILPRGN